MRLSRIFVNLELTQDSTVDLPSTKAHYVRNVLRLKNGQNIILFNGSYSHDFMALLLIEGKRVRAKIVSSQEKNNDSLAETTLIQGIGKSEHIDFLTQKATELGVQNLIFFNAQRTQSCVKNNRLEKKLNRWKDIAISACEQCNRNRIPSISFFAELQSVLHQLPSSNRIVLDFNGKPFHSLQLSFDTQKPFQVLIGPEGGLVDEELKLAIESGFQPYVMGPRVLRMETAAISILTIIQHSFGDMQ